MELAEALEWVAAQKHAVLITIRADGRPQSSDVVYHVEDDRVGISITADRAKTANMRRDHRVVMHISRPAQWSYVALDGTVELTPTTTAIDDEVNDALADYYERVAGAPHPDWPAFRQAMVDEHRLLAWFTPTSAVGQIKQ